MKNALTILIALSITLLFSFYFITPVSALTTYFKDNFPNGLVGQSLLNIDSADYSSNVGYYYTNSNFIYDGSSGLWSNGNTSAGDILKSTSINQSYYCAGMTLQRDINDNRTYPAITINGTNQNDGYIFNTDLNWTTGIIQESSIYTPSKGFLYKTTTLHFNTFINQHWIQACNNSGNLAVYFDGNQLANVVDNSFSGGNVNFSLFYAPHSHIINWAITNVPTINYQDSIGITNFTLPVPLLKQTDPLWGSQIYDSANEWAPSPHQTIANWGCAETSAAMILQYYGITKLPDGTSLDPGSLNTWLKTHNGYVNGGWVYWPAIADLSHLAKLSGNDPNFAYDGLEYLPSDRNDTTLTQDLTNQEPDILEEPKHFVVATGKVNNTFSINDPYYTSTDLTQGYNNKYLAMKRFIPSHTDLSYLTIIADPTLTLTLTDINNVSTGSSYIQNPIADPEDPSITSGNPIKIFDVPKPNTGNYSLTISGQANQPYSVTVYFNDINGNIKDPVVLSGNLDNNGKSIAKIYFDKQSVSNDQIQTIVTFESFILDINHLQNQDQIQNGAGNAIAALAKNASKSVSKTNSFPAKVQLIALQGLLDVFHNRGISDEAYNILSFDVQYLLNSL